MHQAPQPKPKKAHKAPKPKASGWDALLSDVEESGPESEIDDEDDGEEDVYEDPQAEASQDLRAGGGYGHAAEPAAEPQGGFSHASDDQVSCDSIFLVWILGGGGVGLHSLDLDFWGGGG